MQIEQYMGNYQQLFGALDLVVPAWASAEIPAYRVNGSGMYFVEINGHTFECEPLAENTMKISGSNGFSGQCEVRGYRQLLDLLREFRDG